MKEYEKIVEGMRKKNIDLPHIHLNLHFLCEIPIFFFIHQEIYQD